MLDYRVIAPQLKPLSAAVAHMTSILNQADIDSEKRKGRVQSKDREIMFNIIDLHATTAGKPIIDGLWLSIGVGQVQAIIGPNSTEKSTLAAGEGAS